MLSLDMSTIPIRCAGCVSPNKECFTFCGDCSAWYCGDCDLSAHAPKISRNHVRVCSSVNGAGAPVWTTAPPRPGTTVLLGQCAIHNTESVRHYCFKCFSFVCNFCGCPDSQGEHDVRLVSDCSAADIQTALKMLGGDILRALSSATSNEKHLSDDFVEASSRDASMAKNDVQAYNVSLSSCLSDRKSQLLKEILLVANKKRSSLEIQTTLLRQYISGGSNVVAQVSAISSSLGDAACWDAVGAAGSATELAAAAVPASCGAITDSNIQIVMDPVSDVSIHMDGFLAVASRVRCFVSQRECTVQWNGPEFIPPNFKITSYEVKLQIIDGPIGWFSTLSDSGHWVPAKDSSGVLERVAGSVDPENNSFTWPVKSLEGHRIKCFVRLLFATNHGRRVEAAWAPQVNAPLLVPMHFDTVELVPGPQPFMGRDLFSFIGTGGNMHSYNNPCLLGQVKVLWSSVGGGAIAHFVARDKGTDFCYTKDESNSWMMVDIGESRSFVPTAYSLRHDMQGSRGVLRNWLLQGCVDLKSQESDNSCWVTISSHRNDTSLAPTPGSSATFDIMPCAEIVGFRYFRILQNGKNSTGKHRLLCSGFELFGFLNQK